MLPSPLRRLKRNLSSSDQQSPSSDLHYQFHYRLRLFFPVAEFGINTGRNAITFTVHMVRSSHQGNGSLKIDMHNRGSPNYNSSTHRVLYVYTAQYQRWDAACEAVPHDMPDITWIVQPTAICKAKSSSFHRR